MHKRNRQDMATLRRNHIQDDPEFLRGVFTHHAFSPHFHSTYVIEIVERGIDLFLCGEMEYRATEGSIVLINPYEVHTGRPGGRVALEYRSLYPTLEQFSKSARRHDFRNDEWPHFPRRVVHDPQLFEMLRDAHRRLETGDDPIAGHDSLDEALDMAVRHHAQRRPLSVLRGDERDAIHRVRVFLDEAYATKITNDELTEMAAMSQYHFIRVFRKEIGLTPHEYLISVRIENARRLLAEGMPIAETARHSGFFDQSHLTRHFKRLIGVTPGQYARSA